MAHNPLLGSRISLISKKNIRYEGTLYSINESDATVALENVRSYGTEGRELLDITGVCTFVPPQDDVHAYLVFRGQDIKDLHVHEKLSEEVPSTRTADEKSSSPPEEKKEIPPPSAESRSAPRSQKPLSEKNGISKVKTTSKDAAAKSSESSGDMNSKSESSEHKIALQRRAVVRYKNTSMVGSGASLLKRNLRGGKGDQVPEDAEFDFESKLAEFDKATVDVEENDDGGAKENEEDGNVYSKDDFFDTISCDALDKQNGIDNRLRGAAERSLNLDTFGAVSLEQGRRTGRGRGRGGGRGRGPGRGRGRVLGRGRGRGSYNREGYPGSYDRNINGYDRGDGPAPRRNDRWKEST